MSWSRFSFENASSSSGTTGRTRPVLRAGRNALVGYDQWHPIQGGNPRASIPVRLLQDRPVSLARDVIRPPRLLALLLAGQRLLLRPALIDTLDAPLGRLARG